jgi:hypothetical protein
MTCDRYARSKRDADLMVETIEKIIDNNKKSAETQVFFILFYFFEIRT